MGHSDPSSEKHLEETTIIEQVLDGHREAYALLVERYNGSLYRHLLRLLGQPDEAEDLCQDAFLRAYLSLASYDPCYRFSTWLFRIGTNLALNRIKARRRVVSLDELRSDEDAPPFELADASEGLRPDWQIERSELCRLIEECLRELPLAYRAAVTLRHFADLSYSDIAVVLALPVNTVRSRLHRGRERLGECLEQRIAAEEGP